MPDSNEDMLVSGTGDYIGIYTGTSETAPADYTAYTWSKIAGEDGTPGVSNYTHIKYANEMPDSNEDMLVSGTGDYIGIYTGTSETAPIDYTAYTWQKIVGEDGAAGTTNYTHIRYSATMPDANDDILDVASEYIGIYTGVSATAPADYTAYTWYKIKGEQGVAGEDGDSIWLGYDGYLWIGQNKTSFMYDKELINENVAENTLELYETAYFEKQTVDTVTNVVALMGNYFEHINKTFYSENNVTEISFYASEAGKLSIGVADVEEIVAARKTGSAIDMTKTELYDVNAGLNTITLNISVGEHETIVLGGNGSTVNLYAVQGLNATDQYGLYSLVGDGNYVDIYESTNEINNKLIVKVKKESMKTVYTSLTPTMQAEFPYSSLPSTIRSNYYYIDTTTNKPTDRYSGKTITRIDLPLHSVSDKEIAYFTIQTFKIDNSDTEKLHSSGYPDINNNEQYYELSNQIRINIPESVLSKLSEENKYENGYLVEKWVSITGLNIQVPEGHSILFNCDYNALPKYTAKNGKYCIANASGNPLTGVSMLFDVYTSEKVDMSNQLEELKKENEVAELEKVVQGKTISFLGDSISQNNLGLGNVSNEEMWWKQIVDGLSLDLCVNNSISATCMGGDGENAGWKTRCVELHSDTKQPDIIGIFMGTNDMNRSTGDVSDFSVIEAPGYVPTGFGDAYALAVYKMKQQYPNAKILCMTIPDRGYDDIKLKNHNNAIIAVAEHYGCYVVDGYGCGINDATYNLYTYDGTHPNAVGMDLLTDVFVKTLRDIYID